MCQDKRCGCVYYSITYLHLYQRYGLDFWADTKDLLGSTKWRAQPYYWEDRVILNKVRS